MLLLSKPSRPPRKVVGLVLAVCAVGVLLATVGRKVVSGRGNPLEAS
jgi:hypothetical protein